MVALHTVFWNTDKSLKHKTPHMAVFSFYLYLAVSLDILVSIKPVEPASVIFSHTYSAILADGHAKGRMNLYLHHIMTPVASARTAQAVSTRSVGWLYVSLMTHRRTMPRLSQRTLFE